MRPSVPAVSALAPVFAVLAGEPHPPVAIPVSLDRPSCVTLAIEDARGNRVRNIVVDEPLPSGRQVVWWDATDDHAQRNVRVHGGHDITGSLIAPGTYTVRGIARDPVTVAWKFCPYCPNNPIRTADRRGQWMSDHRPPSSLVWLPGQREMIAGSQLAEGAHAIVWLDADGRKIVGNTNVGTHYMGPVKLCRATGAGTLPSYVAYGLGVTREAMLVVGITADRRVETLLDLPGDPLGGGGKTELTRFDRRLSEFSLAVVGQTLAVSWPSEGKLKFYKIHSALPFREIALADSHGLTSDDDGRIYAASGSRIVRFAIDAPERQTVIADDLDEPRELLWSDGLLYVSCHGARHRVLALDAAGGGILRAFGKAGRPDCGAYDETQMHYPHGLALDGAGRLWVAEEDFAPKRLSVWDAKTGAFARAFYGPTQYGGGGKVDPKDPSRFYYAGMEFALDWGRGTDRLIAVFDRGAWPELPPHAQPNDPVYANGRQYFVNVWNGECTVGTELAAVYRYDPDRRARPVALVGQLARAKSILDDPAVRAKFAQPMIDRAVWDRRNPTVGWEAYNCGTDALFAWSDLNDDRRIQADEISVRPGAAAGFNLVGATLNLVAGDGTRIDVQGFTGSGVPVYDLSKAYGGGRFKAKAHQQVVIAADGGWATTQYAPEIAAANGLVTNADRSVKWSGGALTGRTADGRSWFAPNAWSSLHAAQLFPTDRKPLPGEIVGATKIIGPTFTLGPDRIECFALNSNSGVIYILSTDGYFVAPLFRHGYWAKPWGNTVLRAGDDISECTSDGEGFYQSFTKCDDGRCIVQALNHTSSLCEVKGLDTVRRLPPVTVTVTAADCERAKAYSRDREAERLARTGAKELDCTFGGETVSIDGLSEDWEDTEWAYLDEKTEAAVKCDGRMLYAAWRTCRRDLTVNAGSDPWMNLFKSGGGLDLMLGQRDAQGKVARPLRLLVAETAGRPKALLYEPKSAKTGHRAAVSSPNRTLWFDAIEDVSLRIRFAAGRRPFVTRSPNGREFRLRREDGRFYEIAVPLAELGLAIVDGATLAGDLGVLVGDGATTRQRLCWNNKGTQNLFDAPDEAMLTPELWGTFRFHAPEAAGFDGVRTFDSETGGELAVVSSGPRRGMGIGCAGTGRLARRRVGSSGYALFRFDPMSLAGSNGQNGWYRADTRWSAAEGVEWPTSVTDPAAKDGFLFGASNPYRFLMTVDGVGRKGAIGGGGALASSFEQQPKRAAIAVGLKNGFSHIVTLPVLDTGDRAHLDLVQGGVTRRLCDFTGRHPLRFLQFSVKGDFTLVMEQDPWQRGEKRDKAYLVGIFID